MTMPKERRKMRHASRYFRQNKSQAIADIYDALVEMVTNCDDSYHRLHKSNKRATDGGDILIEVIRYRGNKPSRVVVYDKAEGMDKAAMEKNLETVGERTSESGDRGFMGRGIKDCTWLGDVTVESIYNAKYYACRLFEENGEDHIEFDAPIPATAELRKKLRIPKKNGTVVTLEYKGDEPIPQISTIERKLPLHYAFRDLMAKESASTVKIVKDSTPVPLYSPSLYSGKPDVSKKIELPSFPLAECHLKVWRSENALKLLDGRFRESGLLLKGKRAIYQCSLLGYEKHNNAANYCGRVECEYIDDLLEDFDAGIAPVFIVDPNRKTGLNQDHPFTKELEKELGRELRKLLDVDSKDAQQSNADIQTSETRKRLGKLAQMAEKLWQKEFPDDGLADHEARIVDIVNQKGIYILPPTFKVGLGKNKSITVYIKKSCCDPKRQVRVQSEHDDVLELVDTFSKHRPEPHPTMKDDSEEYILSGSIKLHGKSLGVSKITVRSSKTVFAEANGEVVKKANDGDDHHFHDNSDFEFERRNYKLLEGKEKTLKVFVHKRLIGKRDEFVNSKSSRPDYVEVLGGHRPKLNMTPHNYAYSEIRVQGRGVTENRKPAIVTARIGNKVAQTTVRVVERNITSGQFEFELVDENLGDSRARWAELENKPNLLKISAVHPSLKPYFGDAPDFSGQNEPAGRALIAELIIERFSTKFLLQKMKREPGGYRYANLQPSEAMENITLHLQKLINTFSTQAHRIMRDG